MNNERIVSAKVIVIVEDESGEQYERELFNFSDVVDFNYRQDRRVNPIYSDGSYKPIDLVPDRITYTTINVASSVDNE